MRTTLAILLFAGLAAGQTSQEVVISQRRAAVPEKERAGLEFVERILTIGNLVLTYHQTIDPKQVDAPVVQQYGDYRLGLAFPIYCWNWDLEYFLDVDLQRPGGQPFAGNRARLQESVDALERGKRACAEMVWPLPPRDGGEAGKLAVRLIRPAAEEPWVFLECRVEGEPDTVITKVRVGAYPYVTTGPPERQRWATTLTGAYRLSDALTPFGPAAEWGVVLHNKQAQEDGGCLFVCDPREMTAGQVGGTYNVAIHLQTAPGTRAVHLALGWFRDEHYETVVTRFRAGAAAVLDELREMKWDVQVDTVRWEAEQHAVAEALGDPAAPAALRDEWQRLEGRTKAVLAAVQAGGPGRRPAERQFGQLLGETRAFRDRAYAAALKALVDGL
ncbi:MAG: hypothetical protein HYU66_28060 [Armatimonadetes bacterium]|nr:hypothetical protein [Armatimonadota bacterium]